MGIFGLFGKKTAARMLTCECGHVMKGSSDDEVMKLAADHSQKVHNAKMTPEQTDKMRKAIKAS